MDEIIEVGGALAFRKSESLDDWWLIERAEHDGSMGIRRDPRTGGPYLWVAARVSDADIEGNASEMRALAAAIEDRGWFHAGRCAVECRAARAELWSPRNDLRRASVPLEVADALAVQIRAALAPGGG